MNSAARNWTSLKDVMAGLLRVQNLHIESLTIVADTDGALRETAVYNGGLPVAIRRPDHCV